MSLKKIIFTDKAPAPIGPYSQAIKINNLVFISGQLPNINPETKQPQSSDFQQQCKQALENLKAVIEASESTLNNVVKVNIFLTDMKKFSQFNEIYAHYFNDSKPARACVQVVALPCGADVEIEAVVAV